MSYLSIISLFAVAFGIFYISFIIYSYKQRAKKDKSVLKYTKGKLLVNYELRLNDQNRQNYIVALGQENIQQAYCSISIGIIVVLVLILFILVNIIVFRIVHANNLNAKLAELRSAGYPITAKERNAYYPAVPDDENAAIVYQQAFKLFHNIDDKIFEQDVNGNKYPKFIEKNIFGDEAIQKSSADKAKKLIDSDHTPKSFKELVIFAGYGDIPILGERLRKASKAATQQFVGANRDAIKTLQQAAALAKCRFPIDFTTNRSIDLSHHNKLQFSIRLLAIATILAAEADNAKEVVNNILIMLKICRDLGAEPEQYSYWLRVKLLQQTVDILEKTFSLVEFDDAMLQQLGRELEASLDKNGKLMERVLAMTQSLIVDSNGTVGLKILYQQMHLLGIDDLNKLNLIKLNEGLFTMDKGKFYTVSRYQIAFDKKIENITIRSPGNFLIRGVLSYSFYDLYENFKVEAKIKATIIAVAIKRYQLKYHKLPVKLSQLVPAFIKKLPNDPFTGKPFSYTTSGIELPVYAEKYPTSYQSNKAFYYDGRPMNFVKRPGWMVYSFGKDLNDDNGMPIHYTPEKTKAGDIAFKCIIE